MDINEIASIVQQQFLRRRKHLPMIFVELESTGIQVLALPQLDKQKGNTARRARMLFDAGRRFGQRTKWTRPSVTGLCMARLSAPQGIFNEGMLIVKMDEGNSLNCTARFYEMHKEAGGTGVIFLENPFLSGEGLVSPLLPAFMLGIDTIRSQQSTNEASRMLSALLHEYEQMKRGIECYERFPDIIAHY